jgi:cytochrome P450
MRRRARPRSRAGARLSYDPHVPPPRRLPLVGHSLAFLRDKPGFLARCRDAIGDVARLDLGGATWLLNDPADVRHVLLDAAGNYQKTPKLTSRRGRALSGDGLHTAVGAAHLELRRRLQPMFLRRAVEEREAMARDAAARHFDGWRAGETRDLWRETLALAREILLRALLGPGFVDEGGALAAALEVRRAYVEHFFTSTLPVPERWPLPVVRRFRSARRTLHRVLDAEIARRRREGAGGDDWLSRLVAITGRDGRGLSDRQIRDEAVTLTSTGYETVAAAITWTAHLLAHHQQLQGELRAESPLPSGAPLMTRVGDRIYLAPWTLHRHPRLWERPDAFDPDRFTEEASRGRPRFAFLPFGGGARQCLGEPFARLEANAVLGEMLRRFRLEPCAPLAAPLRAAIVLEPRGALPVRLAAA